MSVCFLLTSLPGPISETGFCGVTALATESMTLQADSLKGGSTKVWQPHGTLRPSSWTTWSLLPSTAWLYRPKQMQELDLPQLHLSAPLWMRVNWEIWENMKIGLKDEFNYYHDASLISTYLPRLEIHFILFQVHTTSTVATIKSTSTASSMWIQDTTSFTSGLYVLLSWTYWNIFLINYFEKRFLYDSSTFFIYINDNWKMPF